MCGQRNCRNRCGRMTRQESGSNNTCGCNTCTCTCGCNTCTCGGESTAPTATISMADYEPFILVPTSVFDGGDVTSECGMDW